MKTVDIERLVAWAYREELPKLGEPGLKVTGGGFRGAWGGLERFAELLTVIDDTPINRYGAVIDWSATTGPHPDAVAVGDAVLALDGEPVFLPEGWDPLADVTVLTPEERGAALARALARVSSIDADGRRVWQVKPSWLVRRHAILGGAPDWDAPRPERHDVVTANGQPKWFRVTTMWVGAVDGDGRPAEGGRHVEIEVDGYNETRKRPWPDAYRKTVLDPDPRELAIDRIEWAFWRAALDVLVEDLSDRLVAHRVTGTARPSEPWLDGEGAARGAVLPDLTRPVAGAAWFDLRNRPARAGAPLPRPKAGEVRPVQQTP